MNCLECQQTLQEQLDGCLSADAHAVDGHLAGCSACRELFAAARRLQKGLAAMELPLHRALLTERIVVRVLADRRKSAIIRWRLVPAAMAASILLAFGTLYVVKTSHSPILAQNGIPAEDRVPSPLGGTDLGKARAPTPNRVPMESSDRGAAPSLNQTFAEAGSALAGLGRRTADEAIGQGRSLLPDVKPSAEAPADLFQETLDPSAQSLREAGQGLSVGLEPIAASARRAVNLFLKDFSPVQPAAKQGT